MTTLNTITLNRLYRPVGIIALVLMLGGCASLSSGAKTEISSRNIEPPAMEQNEKKITGSLEEGLRLARMLRDNGRMEGAAGIYARLDQRGELKGALLLEYATVAATFSSPRESLTLFTRARQEMGGDPKALPQATGVALCNGLGRAHLQLGQIDMALENFDCALSLDARNVIALNGKAVILDARGQHEQAQALWREAQDIDPADLSLVNNLALSYMSQGKTEDTIRLLSQLDIPPSMPTLKLNLALAYLLDNQPEKTRQVLESLMSESQVDLVQAQLMRRSARIREGESAAVELLAASREMLALQAQDE